MRWMLAALLCLLPALVPAREAAPAAADPVLEQRLMRLAQELRCLVCQNESLADSHADLAADLRNQIRDQMKAGQSDEQIKAWLTQRYGDFVLYRTPVKAATAVLWFGPFVLLLAGLGGLLLYLGRRRKRVARRGLTPEEQARAQSILGAAGRRNTPNGDVAAPH
ncbi:MAG TPA: cytochrome c-type biogenesis protein [Burkholderiales bacterium]|nr:cytochrome c-type biogenesis protein [Burkholderiales bacterium]